MVKTLKWANHLIINMPRSPRGDLKCTGPSLPSDILILLNGVKETVFAFAEHIQFGVKLVKRI